MPLKLFLTANGRASHGLGLSYLLSTNSYITSLCVYLPSSCSYEGWESCLVRICINSAWHVEEKVGVESKTETETDRQTDKKPI
jgi:hypothetical protein